MTFTSLFTRTLDRTWMYGRCEKSWFAWQVDCTDVFRTSIFDTCTNRQESISVWKVCYEVVIHIVLKYSSKYAAVIQQGDRSGLPDPFTTLCKPVTMTLSLTTKTRWRERLQAWAYAHARLFMISWHHVGQSPWINCCNKLLCEKIPLIFIVNLLHS